MRLEMAEPTYNYTVYNITANQIKEEEKARRRKKTWPKCLGRSIMRKCMLSMGKEVGGIVPSHGLPQSCWVGMPHHDKVPACAGGQKREGAAKKAI